MAWHTDRRSDRSRSRSVHWILDKHRTMGRQAMYFSTMVNQKDRIINEEHCNMKRAMSRLEGNQSWSSRRRAATSPARPQCRNSEYSKINLSLPPPPIILQGHGLFEKRQKEENTLVISSKHFNKSVKKLPFQSLVEYMSNIRRFDQQIDNEARKISLPNIAVERRRQHTPRKHTTFKETNEIGRNYQTICHRIEDEPAYFVLPKCRGLTSRSNRLPSLEYLYNKGRDPRYNAPTPTPQISRQNSYENISDLIVNVDECANGKPVTTHLPEPLVKLKFSEILTGIDDTTIEPNSVNILSSVHIPEVSLTLPEIVITPVEKKDLEYQVETWQQWKLHKLLCQRELRRRELVRLIEDIKEFNDLNRTLKEKPTA